MPRLCLNMIVRNEADRIIRAISSALPYISTFAIVDTGSTDGTMQKIASFMQANDIRGVISTAPFENFSQARNEALALSRFTTSLPPFDYVLLMDADMELVVDDPSVFDRLTGECYEMTQKGGAVSYSNARLLSAYTHAKYVGVTHEYLDCAPAGLIAGAHFVDHADGSNRTDKFERDIRLLEADLERDPNNARSLFYLGNSYRDAGKPRLAKDAFQKRLALGGWDEENFITQCNIACCEKDMDNEAGFVFGMLKAYQMRPSRAEPLYDLSKFFREKGDHTTALLFAKAGICAPRPDDRLFVNDFIYQTGFREEVSISGYYDEATREQAFRVTNSLALDPKIPAGNRHLARSNMVYFLPKLHDICPSASNTRLVVEHKINPGFVAMNPSICLRPNGDLECLVRTVNYQINEHGQYMIGEKGCGDAPIVTENWLVDLDDALRIRDAYPVLWERPPAKFPLVIGLEDMRLFWHRGNRMFNACVREQSDLGMCEQWEGTLARRFGSPDIVSAIHVNRISDGTQTEKNWAACQIGPDLRYVYRLDKMCTIAGEIEKTERPFTCDNISGSSQWIPFFGGYLSVVHEAIHHPAHGRRVYQHRFAWMTPSFAEMKLSLPFVFQDVQIEFCAGIATQYGRVVMSYGLRDKEAWLASVGSDDVAAALGLQT